MQLEGYCPGGLTMGNQAYPNASAPASAIYFTHSKSKSNYALSWLPGKRLSSCSFPNSGQSNSSPSTRRAAPEIEKVNPTSQVASQTPERAIHAVFT
ncbi:hypothetical protein F5887DRAFT_994604 [Amanita rubescens]|nr:hypothetical protein F5887DRAFT_994604 [Amanita rubescens]